MIDATPKSDRAVVDIAKLRNYCLDFAHPDGKHKARVFVAALGMMPDDAEILHAELLRVAGVETVVPTKADPHGRRYALDFEFSHRGRAARIRSSWIVHPGEVSATDQLLCAIIPFWRRMQETVKNFDMVALTEDWPEEGLYRGQVGTILDIYQDAYEVEFSDRDGRTYALLAVPAKKLLVLHFEPAQAAA